jgi:D-alanyl-lipoteichoic acid acyltransferase DltB (MBOAT superfamily)
LSTWFKDYLYIPLGGNRKGKLKQYRNIMIVFITSGLWHGANWTFVIWGALHGIYQIIGSITKPARDKIIRFLHINRNNKIHKLFMVLFTFALVNFGWIFFRANSLADAKKLIANMFIIDFSTLNISTLIKLGLDKYDIIVAMIAILILFIVSLIRRNNSFRDKLNKQNIIVRWSIYLVAIFAILIFGIYGPGYDASQFIYFQF